MQHLIPSQQQLWEYLFLIMQEPRNREVRELPPSHKAHRWLRPEAGYNEPIIPQHTNVYAQLCEKCGLLHSGFSSVSASELQPWKVLWALSYCAVLTLPR